MDIQIHTFDTPRWQAPVLKTEMRSTTELPRSESFESLLSLNMLASSLLDEATDLEELSQGMQSSLRCMEGSLKLITIQTGTSRFRTFQHKSSDLNPTDSTMSQAARETREKVYLSSPGKHLSSHMSQKGVSVTTARTRLPPPALQFQARKTMILSYLGQPLPTVPETPAMGLKWHSQSQAPRLHIYRLPCRHYRGSALQCRMRLRLADRPRSIL
jgi:hypothetical protein